MASESDMSPSATYWLYGRDRYFRTLFKEDGDNNIYIMSCMRIKLKMMHAKTILNLTGVK